jgi:hypothetical protein
MKFCPDYNPCNALESNAGTLHFCGPEITGFPSSDLFSRLFWTFGTGLEYADASRFCAVLQYR